MPDIAERRHSDTTTYAQTVIRTKKLVWSATSPQLQLSSPTNLKSAGASVVSALPNAVRAFVEATAQLCGPKSIHICDGSESENQMILNQLAESGAIIPLPKYTNCWLTRTDPRDVARVESRTFICTPDKRTTIPEPRPGVKGQLGNWISPEDMDKAVEDRFPNCMRNRTMYVIPFSMGPLGSPMSKLGVQITDSAYVVASMRIMTRMGGEILQLIEKGETFVKALHSVGGNNTTTDDESKSMTTTTKYPWWPCDPERTIILHKPMSNEIVSFGSGYGGNSLLGKKCFALRLGSTLAQREGWLAEHMLILGITPPAGPKKYICAAFPSACGKTNLAMMLPSLPGYKIECVGDDIAWIKYNPRTRMLHAINPERGFFGVAPGTSSSTNPNAMSTIVSNTLFTNVAMTSDGGVWWEGMEEPAQGIQITDWRGQPWTRGSKSPAAHPNSRFCSPADQCPIIDADWESPEGVPISAILFGGRRPAGVPLVYQAYDWAHGVFIGSSMRSEATAAAEHTAKVIMHDPFAMRPFFGYNFGAYLDHWLRMEDHEGIRLPKIFHVNWFRKSSTSGAFLWPGYGENIRVLDWILRRVNNEKGTAVESPIGLLPAPGSIHLNGLTTTQEDMEELLSVPTDFWAAEVEAIATYFADQLPKDLPQEIATQLESLKTRLNIIN